MSLANTTRRLTAATAALAAAALPGAAMAGIVVASSGPSAASYPPGKKLPDDAKITLKDADSVTILDSKGTRVLRGAGTFTVGAPGTLNRSTQFAVLTRERSARRVRTGAVRGAHEQQASPNLWYVNVTKPGTFCIVNPAEIRVWRPEKDGDATYRAVSADGADTTAFGFTDGVTVAPWDVKAAPVGAGSTYSIIGNDPAQKVTVTFEMLPAQDYAPEDLAAALMAKGCTGQVDLLATSLALPEDAQTTM
ncbi:hypothetical protein [Novosphingobium album (ex Hu et al. 2023)]|uniref:DUF4412 domain-containing protein n=1 Tax=Novosphingobium album (ex Hu et al. 2023) TaxID=2930093 RepID=A0ABT0AY65_9SPHN|nr:hypothetical protein [Novosphingobium album (ex Hu et al. 2023)]MCJ2177494.1 hypothetical protein [Novosphingobium album (ex Hu et al. 2023)]